MRYYWGEGSFMKPIVTFRSICLLVAVMLWAGADVTYADVTQTTFRDSVNHHLEMTECGNMVQGKMASSAFPVLLKVRGRAVCVRSNYNQVLPVYTHNGSFYAMFRLSKGVNWINGLPRGVYYINNRKITIS